MLQTMIHIIYGFIYLIYCYILICCGYKSHPKFYDTYHAHTFENLFQFWGFLIPFAFNMYNIWEIIIAIIYLNDDRYSYIVGNHHLKHHQSKNVNFGQS